MTDAVLQLEVPRELSYCDGNGRRRRKCLMQMVTIRAVRCRESVSNCFHAQLHGDGLISHATICATYSPERQTNAYRTTLTADPASSIETLTSAFKDSFM